MLKRYFSTNAPFEVMTHIVMTDFRDLLDGCYRAVWLGIDSVERTIRNKFFLKLQVYRSTSTKVLPIPGMQFILQFMLQIR